MKHGAGKMKIGELERVSGVTRSTIHHYENVGLLPPREVRGPRLHLFGPEHLASLLEIKRLRAKGLSLQEIKPLVVRSVQRKKQPRVQSGRRTTRELIVAHATKLFLAHGYDQMRVDNLAAELKIAKATIYRHFVSKEALFVSCVQSVRYLLLSEEQRMQSQQKEGARQAQDRASAVLSNFETYSGLTRLLSSLAHQSDPALAKRARMELHDMITNTEPFLKQQQEAKLIRPLDTELLAYMLWGALMGAGDRMLLDSRYTVQTTVEAYLDFIRHGIATDRDRR